MLQLKKASQKFINKRDATASREKLKIKNLKRFKYG